MTNAAESELQSREPFIYHCHYHTYHTDKFSMYIL